MNMNKIINWESEVSESIYTRLVECRSIKSDIVPLTKVIKKVYNCDNKSALDYMLTWLTDWNNQVELYPSDKDYEKYLKELDKMELLHKVRIDNMDFLVRSIGDNETKQYKTTVYIESGSNISSGDLHTEYYKTEDEMKRRHRYIYKNLEMYIMVDLK